MRDGAKSAGNVLTPDGRPDFTFLAGLTGEYVALSSLQIATPQNALLWATPPDSLPVLGAARQLNDGLINDLNRATGSTDQLENPLGVRFLPVSVAGRREDTLHLFGADNAAGNRLTARARLFLDATLVRSVNRFALVGVVNQQPAPISLGPELGPGGVYSDRVFLVLYLTGLRNRSGAVEVKFGSINLPVTFAGRRMPLVWIRSMFICRAR